MGKCLFESTEAAEDLLFRDQGAAWDIFTIGVFRDLKQDAESADALPKDQEAAAKAAGFEAPNQLGHTCAGLFANTMTRWRSGLSRTVSAKISPRMNTG